MNKKQLDILASFLREDYFFDEAGNYLEMSSRGTDYWVYNVMTADCETKALIQRDDDGYFFTGERGFMQFDFQHEEDIVCGDYIDDCFTDEMEIAEEYKECDDYTVIWIHPVKGGTVCLDLSSYSVSGGENSSYDTPSSFVIINGAPHPLEWRR